MTQSPWSVKGIAPAAREAARKQATQRGQTLGEYLSALLLEEPGTATGTHDAPEAGGAQIVSLTVEEDVGFGPRNRGWPASEVQLAVSKALEAVGLLNRRQQPCSQLSGGELRRTAIAGVLALNPAVVVLDEPFTGLDLSAVQAVLRTLVELHQSGITIILLTHELDKCLALATRLVLMTGGEVLADGSPADLWDLITKVKVHRPSGGRERLAEMTWLA
jgi:biotin transport system ATP-binding protein